MPFLSNPRAKHAFGEHRALESQQTPYTRQGAEFISPVLGGFDLCSAMGQHAPLFCIGCSDAPIDECKWPPHSA